MGNSAIIYYKYCCSIYYNLEYFQFLVILLCGFVIFILNLIIYFYLSFSFSTFSAST